ncbi:glycosyltransferase family 4 protein [Microbacterium sp. 3J1]|uniref:glycosyltransferase family 4 protein n=1 Tax=Microbacterium sp. 3J1 TaxID=861269 RepID=UPI000A57BA98|nr:glycosyltransferase family 4 protein [Microbacterium sp. 3J1]
MVTSPITATTFLGGYLRFLREDGWDVTLICGDGPGVSEMASTAGVTFAPLAMRREPSPVSDLRSLVGAVRLLRRIRPDVLVYATPKASLIGSIAGRITRVPRLVYELWGLRLETAQGVARRIFAALESTTSRLSTVVIANSASLADRARALGVNGGRRVVVLGAGSSHGVDSDFFMPGAGSAALSPETALRLGESERVTIGFIGRIHPDKGIDTLIDALRILGERGRAIQLLLVGGDDGAVLDEELEQLRTVVPVHIEGFAADVRGALSAMDLLVLPSRREGFPNVVLEAAAMEVPAVVSDATGCRDSVVHGVTGRIARTGDPVSLADEIDALLVDDESRRRIGRAARANVVRDFAQRDIWALHSRAWRADIDAVGATD